MILVKITYYRSLLFKMECQSKKQLLFYEMINMLVISQMSRQYILISSIAKLKDNYLSFLFRLNHLTIIWKIERHILTEILFIRRIESKKVKVQQRCNC